MVIQEDQKLFLSSVSGCSFSTEENEVKIKMLGKKCNKKKIQ